MPKFLNTLGQPIAAIAFCDRCQMKKLYAELRPDGDNPGMRVCEQCNDGKDPYTMTQRKTENITLRYPRPEKES